MRRSLIAGAVTGVMFTGAVAVAVNAAAAAATTTGGCHGAKIEDVIVKNDTGHGTPAEWAHLKLYRTVVVHCTAPGAYTITLIDKGVLVTIPGAGNPNGSGDSIAHAVHGTVSGIYHLAATGKLDVPAHRDTTLGSTAYVQSLFAQDSAVTGKDYAWTYRVCGEFWRDASNNNDGQDKSAGGITGKIFPRCLKHHPTPPPVTPTPTPTGSTSPTTPPSGEAPVPTPVPSDLPVTG